MKKLLIGILIAPIAIAAVIIIAAIVVIQWPALVINETTFIMARQHLVPLGIEIQWRDFGVSSKPYGFLEGGLKLEFDGLCITVKPELEKACFDKAELELQYSFKGIMPRLVSVGPINFDRGDIKINIPPKKDDGEKDKIAIPRIELPSWLRNTRFYPSFIGIDYFELVKGEGLYRGQLSARVIPNQDHRLSRFEVKGKVKQPAMKRVLDLTLTAAVEGKALTHLISLKYSQDKLGAQFQLEGTLTKDKFKTTLSGNLMGVSDIITGVIFPQCDLSLVAKKIRQNKAEMNLACPIDLRLKKYEVSPEVKEIYQPPEKLRVQISSRANTFFVPDFDQKIDGSVSVRLEPSKSKLVTTDADLDLKFSGVPSQPIKSWNVESDIDIDFLVKEFSKLVKVMRTTPWPVPAPFNVLEGQVEFSISGHVSSITEFGRFPAMLETELTSTEQKIFVKSEGEVRVGRKGGEKEADLELDVFLTDVQLQLPSLSLAGLPRLTPDGRIILEKAVAEKWKSPLPFKYKAHVSTPKEKPVKILSNLTPDYVPINVDLNIENGEIDGFIKIGKFPIRLFSRKALVEKLNFTLREPRENSEVDGGFSMQFPDMKVMVKIAGTIEQPLITFDSDPPVAQGDIVSALLYGEPLDQIDVDQASTVNNMNAAAADRAMALTSFFLLGSTPIQSIAYNPQTKVFSARVKLGKRTSLNVGAGEEQKSVGLKRRLGKGWSISTGVEKDDESETTAGTAFIEWSRRF